MADGKAGQESADYSRLSHNSRALEKRRVRLNTAALNYMRHRGVLDKEYLHLGERYRVFRTIPGPNGQTVPVVYDTYTGETTIGFPDSYIDPFSEYFESFPRQVFDFLGGQTIDNIAQTMAEEIADDYIGKDWAYVMRRLNFFLQIFDPFPDMAEAPRSKDDDARD